MKRGPTKIVSPIKIPNFVSPYGPKDADFAFVGSYPNSDEVRQGRPFCGDLGTVFRERYLDPLHLHYEDVFLILAIPVITFDSEKEVIVPTEKEINRWDNYLHAQLRIARPKKIIALGSLAHSALGSIAHQTLPHPTDNLSELDLLLQPLSQR